MLSKSLKNKEKNSVTVYFIRLSNDKFYFLGCSMSIRMTLKAFDLKDDTLSDGAWRVLVKLCDLANDHGYTIVGYEHLAESCGGKSVKSIQRHVRTLIEAGYIIRTYRYKEHKQVSNQYQIKIPSQIRGDKTDPVPEVRGDKSEPTGATDLSHRSCLKDPVKDTPIVPNGDAAQFKKNYKFTDSEKTKLVEEWNTIAGERYHQKKHLDTKTLRNITSSYGIYKSRYKSGGIEGELKTKFEFALTLIRAFDGWVRRSREPLFYYRNYPVNGRDWAASIEYATRPLTYEKIINDEY